MKDPDIDILSADGAQNGPNSRMDPRAALVVLIDCYNATLPVAEVEAAALQNRLAEQGVRLVTEEGLRAAADSVGLNFWKPVPVPTGVPYKERVFDYGAWAAAIFAALSGAVTEE